MKFTIIAAFTLIAIAMAQTNNTVPNPMGGTVATASITVDHPKGANAATTVDGNMLVVALTSVAAVYALI
ncbi:hypothetical protein MFLAVUS_006947 [Mucor flavus]|uniref:Uncharacterized protein n=1 Tax=Mucor flavus TaxID=439312 RepID=A0ABP9Z2Y0_9FUNG